MRWLLVVAIAACSKADPPPPAPPLPKAAKRSFGWNEIDAKRPLAEELRRETEIALREGLKPFVYLHADWCNPCLAIERTKTDPAMIAAFAGTSIFAIDVDVAPPAELAAIRVNAGTIPVFYQLDGQGRPTSHSITGGAWGDNIPANMAPALGAFFKSGE